MNILGLSSRYNDIVADGNERLSDEPLKIGTKTNNDLSFLVNNQEQLKLTSSGATVTIDEIKGSQGVIEICDDIEPCDIIEGEWLAVNPSAIPTVDADGKPVLTYSAPITTVVPLDMPISASEPLNISFRLEKLVSGADSVGIGFYGGAPPLTFTSPSSMYTDYFGIRSNLPFTSQSNTGNASGLLKPIKLQPITGGWTFFDAGVYRIRLTIQDGKATWYVKAVGENTIEYRVSTCDLLPATYGANWQCYTYNGVTGSIIANTHVKSTGDIRVAGWPINETFSHLNELANNEAVEQLPKVLKVIDQETNDWKLERKEYEYTLPERSGRLITVDDIAVNDINTELLTLEVAENTTRISQTESDIKDLQGDVIANSNDITSINLALNDKVNKGGEDTGSLIIGTTALNVNDVQIIQNGNPGITIDGVNITTSKNLRNVISGDYAFQSSITSLEGSKVSRGGEPVGTGPLTVGTRDSSQVQVVQNGIPALTIDSANITTNRTLTNLIQGNYAFDSAVQTNSGNIATNAVEIKANDADILDIQNSIAELEVGTGETVDLTALNEAVFVDEPPRTYQKAQWYADYATPNMSFADNVVTKASSPDRDSITSRTELDFLRYDYDILVNIQQVSGSLVHFGFIENELMIDDYTGTWFQVNYKQQGSEWGDGFSARLCYPTATPGNRELSLGFSRQDPSYASTQGFDDLKAGHSILFSIKSGILTDINRRNSPTGSWFKYDFSQFGGLSDPKLRVSPLKKYKMYLSDGSPDTSSFIAAVTYLQRARPFLESEIEAKQPLRADIRRSQFYDTTRGSLQYILSEKNRVITIDTSVYPIYYDGPTANLELLVELDPDSIESDYDIYIKHFGSNNTLTIQSGSLTFDPDEAKINPWCTTVFRIMKEGEEGKTNLATARKLYSDYNENVINWSFPPNVSSTRTDFWAIPFNQEPTSTAHGAWSGRFFVPRRAVLRSLVILGDSEAHNTFLTGRFRVQVYREDADPYVISLTNSGTLIHDRLIKGRNASFIPGLETNTRMVELNVGADPDNISRSTPNVIGISDMGTAATIVPANSTIGLYCIDWSAFDGAGCELKAMMYYQFI